MDCDIYTQMGEKDYLRLRTAVAKVGLPFIPGQPDVDYLEGLRENGINPLRAFSPGTGPLSLEQLSIPGPRQKEILECGMGVSVVKQLSDAVTDAAKPGFAMEFDITPGESGMGEVFRQNYARAGIHF